MGAEFRKRISYSNYFTEQETKEGLLRGLNLDEVIIKATEFIEEAIKDNPPTAKQTIENWFDSYGEKKQCLLSKTKEIEQEIKDSIGILNLKSSLDLLEYALGNLNNDSVDEWNEESDLRLFKAYLLFNAEQDELESNITSKKLKPTEMLFTQQFSMHDLNQHKYLKQILVAQAVKCIYLFELLNKNTDFQTILSSFFKEYHVNNSREWIIESLKLVYDIINTRVGCIDCSSLGDEEKAFISSFEIDTCNNNDNNNNKDYVKLRNKPIIKIWDGTDKAKYIVPFKLFMVENIYKSIKFKLSKIDNKQGGKQKSFFGKFGDSFSEEFLLYKSIEKSFPCDESYIKISGQDCKAKDFKNSEPDYYLRNEDNIFLFESKDVILRGDIKQSYDNCQIMNAIKEKFSGKKGIGQLITNIERIFKKDNNFLKIDSSYKFDTVKIYPILVTYDNQFDTLGLNQILNDLFKIEVNSKFSADEISRIKNLVVINIDTLLLYSKSFCSRGKYGLEVLINKYWEYASLVLLAKDIETYISKCKSFSEFIKTEIIYEFPLDGDKIFEFLAEQEEDK